MWYRYSQAQPLQNLTTTSSPSTISGGAQGIEISQADLPKLQQFKTTGAPVTVRDVSTGKMVSIVHGNVDQQGKFFLSRVGGDVGTEENFNDWAARNGVNPGNFILSCKQGAANTSAFNNLTSYQGVLQLQWSNQPNERGNYNVFVQGG